MPIFTRRKHCMGGLDRPPEVAVLPPGPGDLGQPDQRLNRLDLTEEGLLIVEFVMPPVFEQSLGRRSDAPIGPAREIAPGIDMTSDLIDDRVVAVGFEIQGPLRCCSLAFCFWNGDDETRWSLSCSGYLRCQPPVS